MDKYLNIEKSILELPLIVKEEEDVHIKRLITILESKLLSKCKLIGKKRKLLENITKEEKTIIKKNFTLKYTNCLKEDIIEQFNTDKIKKVEIEDDEECFLVNLKFGKRTALNKNSKMLQVKGGTVEIQTITRDLPWIKQVKVIESGIGNSTELSNCFGKNAFEYFFKKQYNEFCLVIEKEVKKLSPLMPSEDTLITALSRELVCADQDIKLISQNFKMNEYIGKKITSFKCDLVFIFKNTLYIFEAKFRNDRYIQGREGLNCLIYRQYSERLWNYMENKHPSWLSKISLVRETGIGLGPQNIVDLHTRLREVKSLDLSSYRVEEFLKIMKEGKRRYHKVFK